MPDDPSIASEPAAPPRSSAAQEPPESWRALSSQAFVVAGLVLLAFALRLAWIAYADFVPTLSDDAGRYDVLGRSIAHGAGFVNLNGAPTLFWPPGYPFMLAAGYCVFDDSVKAALVLNAALGAVTVALVYAIGRRAFDARTAIVGAALYALMPSAIFFAGVTLSETAFTFVLMLAIWLIIEAAVRRRPALLVPAGIAVGYATLIRGQAALVPVVAVPFWLWMSDARADQGDRRRAAKDVLARVLLVGALAGVVVAPWSIRNYIRSRSPVLISTNAGVDFYIGHSAAADGRGRKVDALVFRYPDLPPAHAEARVSNDGFREGLKYAATHPAREVVLSVRKLFWLYYRDDEALRWTDGHGERHLFSHTVFRALSAVSDVYYWALLALALVRVPRFVSFTRGAAGATRLLLAVLVAYWTITHLAFFGDPRFHAPIMPVLCLWAAVGIGTFTALVRRRAD